MRFPAWLVRCNRLGNGRAQTGLWTSWIPGYKVRWTSGRVENGKIAWRCPWQQWIHSWTFILSRSNGEVWVCKYGEIKLVAGSVSQNEPSTVTKHAHLLWPIL